MLQSRIPWTIYWGVIAFLSCFAVCTSTLSFCESIHPIEVRTSTHKVIVSANTCDVIVNNTDLYEEPDILLPGYVKNNTELFSLLLLRKNDHNAFYTIDWMLMNILPSGNSLTTNKAHRLVLRDYNPPNNSSADFTILVYKQSGFIPFNQTLNHGMITEFKPSQFEDSFRHNVQNYSITTYRTLGVHFNNSLYPGNKHPTYIPVPAPPVPIHHTPSGAPTYNHPENAMNSQIAHVSSKANYTHFYNATAQSNSTQYNSSSYYPRPPMSPAYSPGGVHVPQASNHKPTVHKSSAPNLLSDFKILMLPLLAMGIFRIFNC